MSQLLISSLKQSKTTPNLKRKYEDIISELIRKAEEAFEAKKVKVDKKKYSPLLNSQSGLSLPNNPKMSYKKYTLEQKISILDLIPYMTHVESEKKFGVDESTVRYWKKNGVREDQRKNNGRVTEFEDLEKELVQKLLTMREKGSAVTSNIIFEEFKQLIMKTYRIKENEFKELQNYARYCAKKKINSNIILFTKSKEEEFSTYNNKDEEIKLSPNQINALRDAYISCQQKLIVIDKSWLHRFTQKNNLSYRKITHLSPKTPAELKDDVLDFLSEFHEMRRKEEIPPELIINFDEMAVFFDLLPSYTYESKGVAHPILKTSKVQKKSPQQV